MAKEGSDYDDITSNSGPIENMRGRWGEGAELKFLGALIII